MIVSEKLNIILTLSGLTQEKLAAELGISFATLNSWVNNRSMPHKRKEERIDNLFFKYAGIQRPKDILAITKKEIIKKKARKHKNITKAILQRPDLYDQFILSLTYNTNRIEGSTLTEDETAAIIFQDVTFSNKNLVEHLEAKNHQSAVKYLLQHMVKGSKITEELILKLHSLLMNGIRDDAGSYRRHGVRIVGSNVPTANYLKVSELMKQLIKDVNKKHDDIISHAAVVHSRFEQIHPFSDGNGRVGRLLLSAMLLRENLPPAVIKIKDKRKYLSYLRKSQLHGDFKQLDDLVCDAILNGFSIFEG